MWEDLKKIVHEVINEKVEASGGINTSMLDKRLGDMKRRLAEKMDSLDVHAEPTRVVCTNPNLIDASEEPVVATGNQLCYCGHYWCLPVSFSLPREADRLSGSPCGLKVWSLCQIMVLTATALSLFDCSRKLTFLARQ